MITQHDKNLNEFRLGEIIDGEQKYLIEFLLHTAYAHDEIIEDIKKKILQHLEFIESLTDLSKKNLETHSSFIDALIKLNESIRMLNDINSARGIV